MLRTNYPCGTSALATVLGLAAFVSADTGAQDANLALNQFVTGSTQQGDYSPRFLTDGKVGPRNRWLSTNRSRQQINMFLEEDVEIGSVHVYSFAYDLSPVSGLTVLAPNESNVMVEIAGGVVSGNTAEAVNIVFDAPVTTSALQIRVDDSLVSIDEVAAFPPNGGLGYPLGTGVNLNQARQHRLAFTPASSKASGTRRRDVVDGFVNDVDVWRSSGQGPHWIELDVSDPPETNPADVRVETTPIRVGGAHVYSGVSSGGGVVGSGRFQAFVDGAFVDIAGGSFSGNTSAFLALEFDAPVVTARLRLVIDDLGQVTVREIVPLPPAVDANGWAQGTSVIDGVRPDYRTFGDDFYSIASEGEGLSLTSDDAGVVFAGPDAGVHDQQYQLLLNVGTDTYRIVNRGSRLALAVEGASVEPGASIVEAGYSGLPHQKWRLLDNGSSFQVVNAFSGLAMSLASPVSGAGFEQQMVRSDRPLQRFLVTREDHFPKKGHGGFPQLAGTTEPAWAYNWGKDDTYPAVVDYWPMQWGSFFWNAWPELVPLWKRSPEPIVLMGYNEPDGADQSDIPVEIGIEMWPRLEVQEMPLLAPAPVNPTNSWITTFMDGVDDREMRVEYVAVHSYGSPNADSFINKLQETYDAFGQRDVVVSEFSTVDWSDTNNWTDNDTFNFFAEVFWRMEEIPWLRRYAVFFFTDDPSNPISDNRGEMLNADGTLTPEGMLLAAWDGDTTIRTDTRYHLQSEAQFSRLGVVPGAPSDEAIDAGTKASVGEPYEWVLVPGDEPGRFRIESVGDGRAIAYSSRGPVLVASPGVGLEGEFAIVEQEHGWFYIEEGVLDRRLQADTPTTFKFVASSTTGANVRWRFVPVLGGVPGAPRDVTAVSVGAGEVEITWAEHGFRDLEGMRLTRHGPDGSSEVIADGVLTTSFVDSVPSPGTYSYDVVAVGDTGVSPASSVMVPVETCPADFDGSFFVDAGDVSAAINAIDQGLDFDQSGGSDFFDVLAYLAVFDAGCE